MKTAEQRKFTKSERNMMFMRKILNCVRAVVSMISKTIMFPSEFGHSMYAAFSNFNTMGERLNDWIESMCSIENWSDAFGCVFDGIGFIVEFLFASALGLLIIAIFLISIAGIGYFIWCFPIVLIIMGSIVGISCAVVILVRIYCLLNKRNTKHVNPEN